MTEIKRRNPAYYMKNPTKLYGMTIGNKNYAYRETVKGSTITDHDNQYSPRREDYTKLVESQPRMRKQCTTTSPGLTSSVALMQNTESSFSIIGKLENMRDASK